MTRRPGAERPVQARALCWCSARSTCAWPSGSPPSFWRRRPADKRQPIKVVINSPGGHVESGDTIHDMIRFCRPAGEGDRHRLGGQRRRVHLPGRARRKTGSACPTPASCCTSHGRRARPGLGHPDRGRGDREDARARQPHDRQGNRPALRKDRQGHPAELLDGRRGRRGSTAWSSKIINNAIFRGRTEKNDGRAPGGRGAVVYSCIYVRSFFDADGDGHGDLKGVLAKLDYIEALGVDAIWLSPIHPSPNRDWGYDISDYEGVHPDYGTLADLEALVEAAYARGLKVMLDEVLAHTSDEHPWFAESRDGGAGRPQGRLVRLGRSGRRRHRAQQLAVGVRRPGLGLPAGARRQHYHHKFLRQQPKLNWRARPGTRPPPSTVLDFWLAAADRRLPPRRRRRPSFTTTPDDNPAIPAAERTPYHWSHASEMQRHLHDSNLPENIPPLDVIRRRVDAQPEIASCSASSPRRRNAAAPIARRRTACTRPAPFVPAARLASCGPAGFRASAATRPGAVPLATGPASRFRNHDITRTATRFGGGEDVARLMLALLLSLKGTTLLYQGEEPARLEAQSSDSARRSAIPSATSTSADRQPYLDFRVFLFGIFVSFTLKEFRDVHQRGELYFWQGIIGSGIVVLTASAIAALGSVYFWHR